MDYLKELRVNVWEMKNGLMGIATDGSMSDEEYDNLRQELLDDPLIGGELPKYLYYCETPSQFRSFISNECGDESGRWSRRRDYIRDSFESIEEYIDSLPDNPLDKKLLEFTDELNVPIIKEEWTKAREKIYSDPGGAINTARSLLESVCKHILDKEGIEYTTSDSLTDLYRKVSDVYDFAPEDHRPQEYKRLFGGCSTIVSSLESIRNKEGDSHGKGEDWEVPSHLHAELSVNVSGSISLFLLTKFARNN